MFIETEGTPNPATLKFLPGRAILGDRTADFADADAALISPLAEALFGIQGVARVFLGNDFVTVTKNSEADWPDLKPQILALLMEHLLNDRPIMTEHAELLAEDVDPADIEISVGVRGNPEEVGPKLLSLGASLFTVGVGGPDYDLSELRDWIAWRDTQTS